MSLEIYILAGGKSTRMGQDKGMMLLGNKEMIRYIIETVQKLNLPFKVVANLSTYQSLDVPIIQDMILDKGAMGGLYTALCDCQSDYILLLSCDMPFISVEVLNHIIKPVNRHECLVAEIDGKINPLLAIYKKSLLDDLRKHIFEGQLKMQTFILTTAYTTIKMDFFNKEQFRNINTTKDIPL